MNFTDRKSPRIKSNSAEYQRIHRWIVKNLGKATFCSNNPSHLSNRYDWSNISHQYFMDVDDWRQLCRSCHKIEDGISEAGRKKIIQANKINSLGNGYHNTPVVAINKKTGEILYFKSITRGCKKLGILKTSVSNCLKGRSNSAGGYSWSYGRRIAS